MSWFKNILNTGSSDVTSNEVIDPFNVSPERTQEFVAQTNANQELNEMEAIEQEREKDEQAQADQLVVVHSAKVKMGPHLGEFKVLQNVPTTQGKLTGTIVEKTIANFTFYDGFQLMSILGDWQNYGSYKVQDNEVLIKKSTLQVMGKMPGNTPPETGAIEIIDPGQINIPEQNSTAGAPVPEYQDNTITSPYLFYKKDGKYLAGPTRDSENIFITDKDMTNQSKMTNKEWESLKSSSVKLSNMVDEKGLSYVDFKHFAATVLGESCAGFGVIIKEEIYAFASANDNYRKWYKQKKNKSISYRTVIEKTGAYATTSKQYSLYLGKTEKERNETASMRYANAAIINAIMQGTDFSKGAIKWSGIDMVSNAEKWREGYKFTSMDHDIFYLGDNPKTGKWKFKWESKAAFSGENKKLSNQWWDDYAENTKGSPRALAVYYTKSDSKEKKDKLKKAFYEETTKNVYGTVFCRLTDEYIKTQGGEFY